MTFTEIKNILTEQFGPENITAFSENELQPSMTVSVEKINEVCSFLKSDDRLFFDQLSCLTAIDNGLEKGTIEVIYHLNSIIFEHFLVLKINVLRGNNEELPHVPTVSNVWRTADWHEREAFDLVGIVFDHHPDLRRILLPADWQGHPLRKDYELQESYHGIKVEY